MDMRIRQSGVLLDLHKKRDGGNTLSEELSSQDNQRDSLIFTKTIEQSSLGDIYFKSTVKFSPSSFLDDEAYLNHPIDENNQEIVVLSRPRTLNFSISSASVIDANNESTRQEKGHCTSTSISLTSVEVPLELSESENLKVLSSSTTYEGLDVSKKSSITSFGQAQASLSASVVQPLLVGFIDQKASPEQSKRLSDNFVSFSEQSSSQKKSSLKVLESKGESMSSTPMTKHVGLTEVQPFMLADMSLRRELEEEQLSIHSLETIPPIEKRIPFLKRKKLLNQCELSYVERSFWNKRKMAIFNRNKKNAQEKYPNRNFNQSFSRLRNSISEQLFLNKFVKHFYASFYKEFLKNPSSESIADFYIFASFVSEALSEYAEATVQCKDYQKKNEQAVYLGGGVHRIFAYANFLLQFPDDLWKSVEFVQVVVSSFFDIFKDMKAKKDDLEGFFSNSYFSGNGLISEKDYAIFSPGGLELCFVISIINRMISFLSENWVGEKNRLDFVFQMIDFLKKSYLFQPVSKILKKIKSIFIKIKKTPIKTSHYVDRICTYKEELDFLLRQKIELCKKSNLKKFLLQSKVISGKLDRIISKFNQIRAKHGLIDYQDLIGLDRSYIKKFRGLLRKQFALYEKTFQNLYQKGLVQVYLAKTIKQNFWKRLWQRCCRVFFAFLSCFGWNYFVEDREQTLVVEKIFFSIWNIFYYQVCPLLVATEEINRTATSPMSDYSHSIKALEMLSLSQLYSRYLQRGRNYTVKERFSENFCCHSLSPLNLAQRLVSSVLNQETQNILQEIHKLSPRIVMDPRILWDYIDCLDGLTLIEKMFGSRPDNFSEVLQQFFMQDDDVIRNTIVNIFKNENQTLIGTLISACPSKMLFLVLDPTIEERTVIEEILARSWWFEAARAIELFPEYCCEQLIYEKTVSFCENLLRKAETLHMERDVVWLKALLSHLEIVRQFPTTFVSSGSEALASRLADILKEQEWTKLEKSFDEKHSLNVLIPVRLLSIGNMSHLRSDLCLTLEEIAVMSHSVELLKIVLPLKFNMGNSFGCSLLELAVICSSSEIVEFLYPMPLFTRFDRNRLLKLAQDRCRDSADVEACAILTFVNSVSTISNSSLKKAYTDLPLKRIYESIIEDR